MTKLSLFTICASNYLAQAVVLGASVRQHHPDTPLIVFLIDEPPAGVDLPDSLVIIPARQVFERREWNHLRCHYSLLEFATSVKPACFRYVFDSGSEQAVYLDPDLKLFERIDQFWGEGTTNPELVLTPHLLSPLPNDGRMPDDLVILRAGTYNLGFAAMRNTASIHVLLDWWDQKLRTWCFEDVRTGVFTDQKWMDFAPLIVSNATVLRHIGYNAAYWNLHERSPRIHDYHWCMEDQAGVLHRLVFFHFSGFNPEKKELSRYETRFGWDLPGEGQALFESYASALKQAGYVRFRAIGMPKVTFEDGVDWDNGCRTLYRQSIAEGLELGDPLEDPHFLNWAESPARNDHLSRYSRAILQLRPDLVSNFQDGRDSVGLMAWLRTSGLREMGLSRKLIERMGPTANASRMDANYVGYLRSHLGVGEAARNSVAALEAAGVVVFNHDISMEANAPMGDYSIVGPQWMSGTPAATILGCNADMLPAVLAKLPSELLTPYRIGCWYWETPEFPDRWVDRFDLVDEIWAGSQFIADAIRAKTTIPVLVMPPMVMPPQVVPNRAWLASQIPEVAPDEFLFMFQFDVASVPFRKNPEGVLAAFVKAFRPHEPVRLIVKTLNGYAAPEILDALRKSARGLRVSFMTETLESTERFRLLATIDSFVSLHRSEGFGLSIAEAMAYGVPVLATGWSGNVDFTHDGNAALVPFDLIRSKEAHGPYPLGTVWAEPRTDAAARLMRRMWTEPGWRKEIGKAGQRTINAQLSASVVGLAMRRRLDEVAGLRRGQRPASSAAKATQIGSPATDTSAMLTSKLLKDMRRFPGYYAVRLHKVPVLMWKLGLDGTLNRARVIADSHIDLKDEYLVANLWDRLRKQLLRLRGGSRQLD